MREARRLALARRQLLLAQIARREALTSLADAVVEESKSANLAERSAQLVRDYGARPAPAEGIALRDQAAFVQSLQTVRLEAAQAHADARDQSQWQSRALAAAQSRADRKEQRVDSARAELGKALERRDPPSTGRMARKLHTSASEADAPAHGANQRNTP